MDLTGAGLEIRAEEPGDAAGVRRVNELAFGAPAEADLVEALRARGVVTLSLVAVADGEVVGHILFTPVRDETGADRPGAVGLAPMAVVPERQRQGIGSALVERGLRELTAAGHEFVIVLGHPTYYPRFGFAPAAHFDMQCEFDAPEEAFLALELREGALADWHGVARYQPEFAEA
jgi:putative acetyltransferase